MDDTASGIFSMFINTTLENMSVFCVYDVIQNFLYVYYWREYIFDLNDVYKAKL